MHVYSVDDDDSADGTPSRLARVRRTLSTAVGATIALALLLAIGGWFYRLGVRDAGNVPIIRASAEPAKTRPEDPGGVVTPHQNITSYQVAESRPAHASTAVIAPPPQAPSREDVAMGKLPPPPAERPKTRKPAAEAAKTPSVAPPPSRATDETAPATGRAHAERPDTPTAPEVAEAPPPSEAAWPAPRIARAEMALAQTGTPDTTAAPEMTVEAGTTGDAGTTGETDEVANAAAPEDATAEAIPAPDAVPDPVIGGSEYAPPLSPVAPARPGDLMARMAAAEKTAERSADDLVQRAANSDIQVQLAADPDEVVIRQMWERIRQANSDILHDRALAVQTTMSGGTKFYRLRVGPFSGMTEARAVCQALKARGQDCIVARNG